ncbi:MAG: pilin [Planctomycetes bacterium]|jgi:hypothetical protein|nr:pilin [Planctomycetota bacterium]
MIKKNKKILISLFSLFLFLFLCYQPLPALAQNAPGTLMDYIGGSCQKSGDCDLNDFVRVGIWVTRWILGIVGSLTLLMFVYGGFQMMTSAGQSEKIASGKKIILNAIIGLIIVFSAYMLVDWILKNVQATDEKGQINAIKGKPSWNQLPEGTGQK